MVPLPTTEVPHGWFGGKPSLPSGIDWPTYDGKPMLFLAQLNCADLPKQLWGGVGPRHGYLLFFIPLCFLGADQDLASCSVLHVDGTGTERTPSLAALSEDDLCARHWMWTLERDLMPVSATPFPKCPVRFLEVAESAEGTADYDFKNPLIVDDPEWTSAETLYPVTWALFDELLEVLSRLVSNDDQFGDLANKLTSIIAKIEETPVSDRTVWEERQLKICQDALHVFHKHQAEPAKHKDQFQKRVDEIRRKKSGSIVTESDWDEFVELAESIDVASVDVSEIRGAKPQIQGFRFSYETVFKDKPETYGEYFKVLSEVISSSNRLVEQRRGGSRIDNRIAQDMSVFYVGCDVDVEDADIVQYMVKRRQVAKKNIAELEAAKSKLNESRVKAIYLRHKIGGRDRHGDPISDEDWLKITPDLACVFSATEEMTVEHDQINALNHFEFTRKKLLDQAELILRDWKRKKQIALLSQYAEGPDNIPEKPRRYVAHECLINAHEKHDGLGGLPRWEWDVTAPFNKQSAVVLQLFSSHLPGWLFGDVGYVVFLISHKRLARGDFSKVEMVLGA